MSIIMTIKPADRLRGLCDERKTSEKIAISMKRKYFSTHIYILVLLLIRTVYRYVHCVL